MNRRISLLVALAMGATVFAGCGIGDAQTQLRTAVDEKREELNACYADALGRDATAAGSMHAWIHVEDGGGQVDAVEFDESDIEDEALQACMTGKLTTISLSQPPAANLKVEYTFEFAPAN